LGKASPAHWRRGAQPQITPACRGRGRRWSFLDHDPLGFPRTVTYHRVGSADAVLLQRWPGEHQGRADDEGHRPRAPAVRRVCGSTGTIVGGVRPERGPVQIHFATITGIGIYGGSGPFGGPFDHLERYRGQPHQQWRDRRWLTVALVRLHPNNTVNGPVNPNNNVPRPGCNEYVTNTIRGSF